MIFLKIHLTGVTCWVRYTAGTENQCHRETEKSLWPCFRLVKLDSPFSKGKTEKIPAGLLYGKTQKRNKTKNLLLWMPPSIPQWLCYSLSDSNPLSLAFFLSLSFSLSSFTKTLLVIAGKILNTRLIPARQNILFKWNSICNNFAQVTEFWIPWITSYDFSAIIP